MLGTKIRTFGPLPNLSLEELVPGRWALSDADRPPARRGAHAANLRFTISRSSAWRSDLALNRPAYKSAFHSTLQG